MSGHSKWANIKHRKEKSDKEKGKIFSRIMKEVISAVKQGGIDPKSNNKLRIAIQKAKEANIPSDNIERNIKKAASANQNDYSEVTYELYGHGGVGIIVEAMTDNKNRMSSDLHIAINKCGGTIALPGSVSFSFDRKGIICVLTSDAIEEELFNLVSENGADDFEVAEDIYVITTPPESFYKVKEVLERQRIKMQRAILEMIPKNCIECSKAIFDANTKLINWLENIDDVDQVFHNMKED